MKNLKFTCLLVTFAFTSSAWSTASADGPKLTTNVRAVEFQRDGKVLGLRLFNVSPDSGFGRAGFLDGDVIKSMNGTQISEMSQMMTLIASNEKVVAVVIRQDKDITLEFAGRKPRTNAEITNDSRPQIEMTK